MPKSGVAPQLRKSVGAANARKQEVGHVAGPGLSEYLTREEALKRLEIKPQSLYAYVSRGLIRRVPQIDNRKSLYLRDDIERVKSRHLARAGHGAVAASAMRWGEPVVDTQITEITDAGPRYRNRLATDLVRMSCTFESVAELLWSGSLPDPRLVWPASALEPGVAELAASYRDLDQTANLVPLFGAVTVALGLQAGTRAQRLRNGSTPVVSGRHLLRTMAGVFGFLRPRQPMFVALGEGEQIAAGILRALGRDSSAAAAKLINAVLVLCADHELYSATFAARVAASGGSDLHACLSVALATQQGSLTGEITDATEQLFDNNLARSRNLSVIAEIHESGNRIPGFNHRLYPKGDPRATLLLELVRASPYSRRVSPMLGMVEDIGKRFAARPSMEIGVVGVTKALGLPEGSASALFAISRSAGWIAHIIEQRLAGFMIRPRARYIGPPASVPMRDSPLQHFPVS